MKRVKDGATLGVPAPGGSLPSRTPRVMVGSLAAALTVTAVVGVAAPAVAQTALPDGRAYELVSPADKNLGDVVRVPTVSDDGETAGYLTTAATSHSNGAFVVSTGVARRTAGGWQHESADGHSPGPAPTNISSMFTMGYAEDFSSVILQGLGVLDPADGDGGGQDVYRVRTGTGRAELISYGSAPDTATAPGGFYGASADLEHVFFMRGQTPYLHPDANGTTIYERVGSSTFRIASRLPDGSSATGVGSAGQSARTRTHTSTTPVQTTPAHGSQPVSRDGKRLVFAAGGALFIRVNGTSTIPVSLDRKIGATPNTYLTANLIRANEDGTQLYFATDEQLTDTASPGGGIYSYDESASQLITQITPPTGGAAAGIAQAMASADQSRVFFITNTAYGSGPSGGVPNLYVWSGGTIKWLGAAGAGTVLQRVSANGRYAVLTSSASLSGANNGGRPSIYLADSTKTGFECASCRADDSANTAAATIADTANFGLIPGPYSSARNIADDGSVFFASADALVAEDINGKSDVYRYKNGDVALLSAGTGVNDSFIADNSDDGGSAFLITRDSLVPQDIDGGSADLYVARVGGGIPVKEEPKPCEGDACQGPPPTGPVLPTPGTTNAGASGNVIPPPAPPVVPGNTTPTVRVSMPAADVRRRLARSGSAKVKVKVEGGGTVRVKLTGRVRGKSRTIASTSRTIKQTSAVTANVRVRLSSAARRELRRGRSIKVTLRITVSGGKKSSRVTFTLKRA